MVLKFNISEAKELQLKVRRWGLILTFLEVTGEKLVGGGLFAPFPTPSWIGLKHIIFKTSRSKMFCIYSEKFWKGKHSHLRGFSFDKDTGYRHTTSLKGNSGTGVSCQFCDIFYTDFLWNTCERLLIPCIWCAYSLDREKI